jgi:hypothetical protein
MCSLTRRALHELTPPTPPLQGTSAVVFRFICFRYLTRVRRSRSGPVRSTCFLTTTAYGDLSTAPASNTPRGVDSTSFESGDACSSVNAASTFICLEENRWSMPERSGSGIIDLTEAGSDRGPTLPAITSRRRLSLSRRDFRWSCSRRLRARRLIVKAHANTPAKGQPA